jgi:hypothetical protein
MLSFKFNEVWVLSIVLRTVILSQDGFQLGCLFRSDNWASF